MKRFVVFVLAVSAGFVGLGSLAEYVGAQLKSDEKALDIIRKARTAIGGDAAIAEVRGMVISGRTTHQFKVDGAERSEQGETEIAMQFPDKLMRSFKIGRDEDTGAKAVSEQHDVMVFTKEGPVKVEVRPMRSGEVTTPDGKKIIVKERSAEGEVVAGSGEHRVFIRKMGDTEGGAVRVIEGDKIREHKDVVIARSAAAPHAGVAAKHAIKQNEMLRLTLALLLTAPEGMDVSYTFAGETDVDGVAADIVNAEFGGVNYKLYIAKSNNLPVAMSYEAFAIPTLVRVSKINPGAAIEPPQDTVVFTKKLDAPPMVEHFVKFSDYRSAGNVQLPYRWTTSVGGVTKEILDVTAYDINPAKLAERFQTPKTFVRTKKPDGQ